jgi:microcystin-dependent protein
MADPNPVRPAQFCDAIPANNADLCTRFSKWLGIPQLLCDLFSWMFNSDGSVSDNLSVQVAQLIAPTGTITYSLTLNMGPGWILADGSEISRTTYANLFAAVGTRYGAGDGSTTFALPDLRGRSLIGAGQGTGLTNRDINTITVGEERHTQTEAELATHRHAYSTADGQQILVQQIPGKVNDIDRTGSLDYAFADPMDTTGSSTPFNVTHACLIAYPFVKT